MSKASIRDVTTHYYGRDKIDAPHTGLNTILVDAEVKQLLARGKVIVGYKRIKRTGKFSRKPNLFRITLHVEAL